MDDLLLQERSGLKKETIQKIRHTFKSFPDVQKAILYGSRAKGNFRNGSDIDICLVGKKLTSTSINQVALALDDLMLPYSFDISIYHLIDNPDFVDHIDRVGLVFYQTE